MDIVGLVIWLAVGALAGFIAGNIMKGGGFGTVGNIIVGIIGSFVGGWLATFLGIGGADASGGLNIASIVTSVVGACVLLFIVGLVKKAT
jgi:Predicted membrane protein